MRICASVLTAVYWWIVFTIVYIDVLFAGDRSPTPVVPSEHEVLERTAVIVAISVAIYALLLIVWGRLRAGSWRKR